MSAWGVNHAWSLRLNGDAYSLWDPRSSSIDTRRVAHQRDKLGIIRERQLETGSVDTGWNGYVDNLSYFRDHAAHRDNQEFIGALAALDVDRHVLALERRREREGKFARGLNECGHRQP